jgi:general secretion pathway protein I
MRSLHESPTEHGFTLLEVLVALVIFALLFGVLGEIVQTGLRQSDSAEASSKATLLAESQLARVGVELPLEVSEWTGETGDGLRWRTGIQLAEPASEHQSLPAYEVQVTVSWGSSAAERVTLTTLRIGSPAE